MSRLAQTSDIDRAFRDRVPSVVVGVASVEENRENNTLKQHGVNDEALFSELVTIYNQHHLSEVRESDRSNDDSGHNGELLIDR